MRELHPVLVLIVRSRARQQDLEADLRQEGQPNRQQVLEPVHQQPHGVDGEDLLPRKRAQPQLADPSGPARAQLCHSGLGARSARLLQRHRPDGAEAQAAPDEIRQLGGHGANWFELNKLLSRKIIKSSDGRTGVSFFLSWLLFCPGSFTASRWRCPAGSAQ